MKTITKVFFIALFVTFFQTVLPVFAYNAYIQCYNGSVVSEGSNCPQNTGSTLGLYQYPVNYPSLPNNTWNTPGSYERPVLYNPFPIENAPQVIQELVNQSNRIPTCREPQNGVYNPTVNITCSCPNGSISYWNNGGSYSCGGSYQWDQLARPAYDISDNTNYSAGMYSSGDGLWYRIYGI